MYDDMKDRKVDDTTDIVQDTFFALIPKAVIYHPELTGNDVRVYATLAERAGTRRASWPGMRRIANDIGLSTTTVQSSIERLEKVGVIEVDRSGKSNRYYLPPVVPKSDTVTVPKSDTVGARPSQKLTRTVSESDTELDQRTIQTSPNGDASELFEAFYEFWTERPYGKGATLLKPMRGRLNQAVKDALAAGLGADEVRVRGERYRRLWPKVEASPQALLANWDRFAPDSPDAPVSTEGRVDPSPDRNNPETCVHRAVDGGGWCAGCSSTVAWLNEEGKLKWLPGKNPKERT